MEADKLNPHTSDSSSTKQVCSPQRIALFEMRMSGILTHRWNSAWQRGNEQEQAMRLEVLLGEWSEAIAPLSNEQIRNGLDKIKKRRSWWPDIGDFLGLSLNLPTKNDCITRIVGQLKPYDEVSYLIVARLGQGNIDLMSNDKLSTAVGRAYQDAYDHTLTEKLKNGDAGDLVSIEDAMKNMTTSQKGEFNNFKERQADLLATGYPVDIDPTMDFEDIKDILGGAEHKRWKDNAEKVAVS